MGRRERRSAGLVDRVLAALEREPVRVRLYTFLTLLCGYLVYRGVITGRDTAFYLAVASVLLGIPTVESARRHVSPVAPSRT